jgi:lipopolysaccharide/colanic/teichoic acid biosynthesis glycosyltransferase
VFQTFAEMLPQRELTAGSTGAAHGLRRSRPTKARSSARASGRLVRLLDVVIAVAALVFFLPVMIMIALAILATGGGPVFFVQSRVGRNGIEFRCFKFRTMSNDAEAILAAVLNSDAVAYAEWSRFHKLRDDPRVGRLGAILRKTSLDELPQLFNVLRGDMSIVGPRPIVAKEAWNYRPLADQRPERHNVSPARRVRRCLQPEQISRQRFEDHIQDFTSRFVRAGRVLSSAAVIAPRLWGPGSSEIASPI